MWCGNRRADERLQQSLVPIMGPTPLQTPQKIHAYVNERHYINHSSIPTTFFEVLRKILPASSFSYVRNDYTSVGGATGSSAVGSNGVDVDFTIALTGVDGRIGLKTIKASHAPWWKPKMGTSL